MIKEGEGFLRQQVEASEMKWDGTEKFNFKDCWWLASFPKSGNTWLRFLYIAHEQDGYIDINSNTRITMADSLRWAYNITAPWPIHMIPLEMIPYFRVPALMAMQMSKSANRFVVKTHCANIQLNYHRLIPYEMTRGAVYMVRDPRDLVISYASHFNRSIDDTIEMLNSNSHTLGIGPGQSTIQVPIFPASWSTNVESWLFDERWERMRCKKPHLLKYEDLKKDTMGEFIKVLEYMEIEPKNVAKCVKACELAQLQKQEKKNGFIENSPKNKSMFFRKGATGEWKGILSKDQLKKIVDCHGSTMEKLGYL